MAFFIQYRNLKRHVNDELNSLKDQEKATPWAPSPRLSGETTRGSPERKDSQEDTTGYTTLAGISSKTDKEGKHYYQVDFEENDINNPKTWGVWPRLRSTFMLTLIAFIVTAASSIDAAVLPQAAKTFGVSDVTEALGGTGIFLATFGFGGLFLAPLSEMLGRWPVYLLSLFIFGCWLIGAALSPNIGAQIAFRGLAGFFASAPLTVCGGSMSDLWTIKERTWTFPLFAIAGFGGPVLGPVIAAYIGTSPHVSWRWTEWITLIANGLVMALVVAFMHETSGQKLLKYKSAMYRKATGERFLTQKEAEGLPLGKLLKANFTRPFILAIEPIVVAYTVYLTVVYIILFTFLDGYTFIFQETYNTSQGIANICFIGLLVGILLSMLSVPLVIRVTNKQLKRDGDDGTGAKINPEIRTIFSMIGAPLIPIGLFWMGWTDYASISIWSPLAASVVIGTGIVLIFMSGYMYIIDSYEFIAASALTFITLVRYMAAAGMTVVGIPMYKNLGTHWTLTVLGAISAVIAPIPYLLYFYGAKLRSKSKYAVKRDT